MGDAERPRELLSSDQLLLTPEEAAQVLRVGRTTIYALMKVGDLLPVHIGRSCRISRAELERYVRCLATPSQSTRRPTDEVGAEGVVTSSDSVTRFRKGST
jgi:excisionase family DNA binding protein